MQNSAVRKIARGDLGAFSKRECDSEEYTNKNGNQYINFVRGGILSLAAYPKD